MQIILAFLIFQNQGVLGSFQLDYWKFRKVKGQDRLFSEMYISPYFGMLRGELSARLLRAPMDSFGTTYGEDFEGIYRKSISVEEKNFELHLFDFYRTFGRGLVFSFVRDETVQLDRFLRNGIFFNFALSKFSFSFLYGKPVEYLYFTRQVNIFKDTLDEFRAFNADFRILPGIDIGGYWTEFHSRGILGKKKSEFLSGRISLKGGWLRFYEEFTTKKGWDKYAVKDTQGFGNYIHTTLSLGNIVFNIEYEKYRAFGTPYSLPPSINNFGLSLTNGRNEEGYGFNFLSPFLEYYFIQAHYSKVFYRKDRKIEEIFGEFRFDKFPFLLLFTYDDIYFLNAGIDVPKRFERRHNLEFLYTFNIWTTGFKSSLRFRKDFITPDSVLSYKEPYFTYEFLYPYGSLSLNWTRDRERKNFFSIGLRYQVNMNLEFDLFWGKQKRDIVCSGGVCRFEPEFDGAKIKAVYSF